MKKIIIAILVIAFGIQTPLSAGAVFTPLTLEEHNKRVIAGKGGYLIPEAELEAYRELYNTKFLPWSITSAVYPETRETTDEEKILEYEVARKYIDLTPEQLAVYKNLSQDLCLNILLGSDDGVIYNGEYLEKYPTLTTTSSIEIESMRIAGDRLGYVHYDSVDRLYTEFGSPIIVDGEEIGRGLLVALSEDHVAYLRQTNSDPSSGDPEIWYNLMFDGKDLGRVMLSSKTRFNGGRLLYGSLDQDVPYAERKSSVFMDGERIEEVNGITIGDAAEIDFDGKNLAIIDMIPIPGTYETLGRVIYNGSIVFTSKKILANLRVKDGHYTFQELVTPVTLTTFYDGRDVGNELGYAAVILGDEGRLAYWKDGDLFFEGRNYGSRAGIPNLAGDHIAFMEFPQQPDASGFEQRLVNIDGYQYGIGNQWSGVLITEKSNCIEQGALLRAKGGTDVWVVKQINGKKFKRLILSPKVFESYAHLRWNRVKEVAQSVLDEYTTSDLVRAEGDTKVYRLFPQGDTGIKRWVSTMEAFITRGFDWDAVYTINTDDRDAYLTGEPY